MNGEDFAFFHWYHHMYWVRGSQRFVRMIAYPQWKSGNRS